MMGLIHRPHAPLTQFIQQGVLAECEPCLALQESLDLPRRQLPGNCELPRDVLDRDRPLLGNAGAYLLARFGR
ncbi:MAG: hypothetical protein AB7O38_23050 [Pirellulaceae bacterium]